MDSRCHSVVVLDVTGISPICDFFIIATGTSARQMRSVADDIAELGEKKSLSPISQSGEESATWILVDCVDVLVHLFSEEGRQYYDLDNLWGDAKPVKWEK